MQVSAQRPLSVHPASTDLLVWGATIHLVVDWMGQNAWIAANKSRMSHPAGYLHAALHGAAQLLVFPPPAAAALGVAHLLIDTRRPLAWWSKVMAVPPDAEAAAPVQMGRDQAAHLACIAVAALLSN